MPMTVKLSAGRNRDFPRRPLPKSATVTVASFGEAARVCRDYIETHDLGGGNWTGGDVREGGRLVAHVSYNGRVWGPGPYPQPEIIVEGL